MQLINLIINCFVNDQKWSGNGSRVRGDTSSLLDKVNHSVLYDTNKIHMHDDVSKQA